MFSRCAVKGELISVRSVCRAQRNCAKGVICAIPLASRGPQRSSLSHPHFCSHHLRGAFIQSCFVSRRG